MDEQVLDSAIAREIIERVGSSGQPPEYGVSFYTAGFDSYLKTIEDDYLATYISKQNGKAFKFVVGYYGGGKTHFLYSIRELAWKHKFAVSYVELQEKTTPFHKMEFVYKAIVNNLMYPMSAEELMSGYERGIANFIRVWYQDKKNEFENIGLSGNQLTTELNRYINSVKYIDNESFRNAVCEAFRCLIEERDDNFSLILQWLQGAPYLTGKYGHSQFHILDRIDSRTAFPMIRSAIQWTKSIGYSGLVVLLDETEMKSSMSGKEKGTLVTNLRELIDECGRGSMNNSMFFYSAPDTNFLAGKTGIYDAASQRLRTVFDTSTPTGVNILLDELPLEKEDVLKQIGSKLARIYETAFSMQFTNRDSLEDSITNIAKVAADLQFTESGYRRLFVQKMIQGLHLLRKNPDQMITVEKAKGI